MKKLALLLFILLGSVATTSGTLATEPECYYVYTPGLGLHVICENPEQPPSGDDE